LAHTSNNTKMTDKKVLLMLDLNGTIAYRSEAAVRGVEPLLNLRRKNYYPRIGVMEFIKKLDAAGFAVSVYTSVMRHNVLPFILALVKDDFSKIYKIYDRDYNKPDPNAEKEWDTIRDMDKIWSLDKNFGPKNTILLDNESRKFQDFPRNGIVVPEFGEAEVRSRSSHTLDTLRKYLLRMSEQPQFKEPGFDVRVYMEKFPYDPLASMDELISKIEKLEVKEKKKSLFERCLLEKDLGGTDVRISEVDGTTIRFYAMAIPTILIKVECKEGLVFKDKMQVALLMTYRDKTKLELFVNNELQTENVEEKEKKESDESNVSKSGSADWCVFQKEYFE